MTRVLITGGRGGLGSEIAPRLEKRDYTVRIMSRSAASSVPRAGMEWAQADLITGEGLAQAVDEVDVVVHAASQPFGRVYETDVEGTQRLLSAGQQAGVKHVVYISIVGIDKIPYAYYQHKLAAEQLIAQSSIPWTVLRAPQFFTLLDAVLSQFRRWPVWPLPLDFQCQPMDTGEVAAHMVELVEGGPAGRVPDIAGPEVLRVGEIARMWQQAQGMRRPLLHLPLPGKVAAGFRRGYNTAPHSRYGKITWAEWVQRQYQAQAEQSPTAHQ